MCEADIEHLLHVFFDCPFARQCWLYTGGTYDMSSVENAPEWLIHMINTGSSDEVIRIARVLWGIWFFRNKKVWESKTVSHTTAMDWSIKTLSEWRAAKLSRAAMQVSNIPVGHHPSQKWLLPEEGSYKLNVDASICTGSENFSTGMILRDHEGSFVAGRVSCSRGISTVFEAEATAIYEGLCWLLTMPYQRVMIVSDPPLSVQAVRRSCENQLQVGHFLDNCRSILHSRVGFSISFVKRQANKVAHKMARLPCLLNCQNVFTSPTSVLLENPIHDLIP